MSKKEYRFTADDKEILNAMFAHYIEYIQIKRDLSWDEQKYKEVMRSIDKWMNAITRTFEIIDHDYVDSWTFNLSDLQDV